MDEGDAMTAGTDPRDLIHQLIAGRATRRECPIEIGHPIADVVNAGPPAGQEPGDRTLGRLGLQELHLRGTEGKGHDPGAVGPFWLAGREAQDVAIKGKRAFDTLNGDADVGDDRTLGHGRSGIGPGLNGGARVAPGTR